MKQVPDSLLAFQHMFPDDDACAAWLIEMSLAGRLRVPRAGKAMGAARVRRLDLRPASCRSPGSAAYLMATHSNGILPCRLGTALPRARPQGARMVHERNQRGNRRGWTKDDPPTGGQGRSHDGKMLIVGAIELGDGNIPGRLRLAEISSYGAADLGHFGETAADRRHRENRRLVRLLRSPPIEWVGKTAAHLVPGSTKSSPTSKDGRATGSQFWPRCFPLALPPRHRTPYLSMLIEPELFISGLVRGQC